MVKKTLILIFTILCCFNMNIKSIYLHTKSYKNEYCMSKDIEIDDSIHISYLITGDSDEEKIDAKFGSPENNTIKERLNESGGEFKIIARETGKHTLCFFVPKPGENFISFEFYTTQEKGHTLDMAKDGMKKIILYFIFP